MKAGIKYAGSDDLPDIDQFGVGPVGNRVGERDPRGTYGERQSVPTNILGERAQTNRSPGELGGRSAGQFPANQLPDRTEFEVPAERGPFGVLHQGQTPDSNRIAGENTMGHHLHQPLPPGAGAMDEGAKEALGLDIYGIPPMHNPNTVKAQRFDSMLAAYDQFAANIEQNLLELRALDQARFDAQFPHLAKVNLPRSKPDPTLQPGFTTMEAALLRKGIHAPAQNPVDMFSPGHRDYRPPTEAQKLMDYSKGGYANMPPRLFEARGVTAAEVEQATARANAARSAPSTKAARALPEAHPHPWK